MKRLAILAALALVGCAAPSSSDPYVNAVQRYGLACDAYSTSLNTLSMFRETGQLKPATIKAVDQVIAVAAPICEADSPPVNDYDLLLRLEKGVLDIITLRRKVTSDAQD